MNPTSISNKVQLHNLTSHASIRTELVSICYLLLVDVAKKLYLEA